MEQAPGHPPFSPRSQRSRRTPEKLQPLGTDHAPLQLHQIGKQTHLCLKSFEVTGCKVTGCEELKRKRECSLVMFLKVSIQHSQDNPRGITIAQTNTSVTQPPNVDPRCSERPQCAHNLPGFLYIFLEPFAPSLLCATIYSKGLELATGAMVGDSLAHRNCEE